MKNGHIEIPREHQGKLRYLVIYILYPDRREAFISDFDSKLHEETIKTVSTPDKAYHWHDVDLARKAAEYLAANDLRGCVVSLRAYQPIGKNYISRIF